MLQTWPAGSLPALGLAPKAPATVAKDAKQGAIRGGLPEGRVWIPSVGFCLTSGRCLALRILSPALQYDLGSRGWQFLNLFRFPALC
ncbi:hypothetical protein NDU88_002600 [Pleurodeles waltl]|uniref:Uncharacterized protein n=1 Tax=Pleurodeles waltl TaxID=8319 RepID=A0AAV7LG73_PLEWA|nr:hypothetical protein NDU88_002600 [Pleurodeles waltl]